MKKILFLMVALGLVFGMTTQAMAGPLPGAIFTTLVDGSRVNANIYQAKEDVYLDGGPGPNAPQGAAGLPDGDYYFQVTDPSGKVLLSVDPIASRKVWVADGIIVYVYPAPTLTKYKGVWYGTHATGTDIDHNALTVQLMPYADTPNNGGVYKVWITPCEQYSPGSGSFGFIPAWSKTDNFKVKGKKIPPIITVKKFHDKNLNGVQDAGEESISGWAVDVEDPLTIVNTVYTPAEIMAVPSGAWKLTETTPAGTLQTVSRLDGNVVSLYPTADPLVTVNIAGTPGEIHEVVYGNVGLGSIIARKVYDRNGNGEPDLDEPGVQGWKMKLTGMTVNGLTVGPIVQTTGGDGNTTFANLLPGSYTVTEIMPVNNCWQATSPTYFNVTIESVLEGSNLVGKSTPEEVTFTNLCKGHADFDTKGYWHNKNGLSELTEADRDYVNGLDPYDSPSSYFEAGDEPFDGYFSDGTTKVAAAFNNEDGSLIWGAGTWQAEISHFLVDSNAGGDPREQLAQQLLAFIFNTRHRLDNPGAAIQLGSTWVPANELIDTAVQVWANGWGVIDSTYFDRISMQQLLNSLNESDNVPFIHYNPCPVVYP